MPLGGLEERERKHLALDPETAMPAGEEEQIVAGAGRKAAAAEAEAARGGGIPGGQNPSRRRGLVGWGGEARGEELPLRAEYSFTCTTITGLTGQSTN